ncbi:MAG: VOC family protein [Micromonosporaceae bacterium]
MDVLSSRILLRPTDLERSQRFYRDVLGLAIYREFGPPSSPGMVFFLGSGFLEVSGHSEAAGSEVSGHGEAAGSEVSGHSEAAGHSPDAHGPSLMIWAQVRDVRAEHDRLSAAGVRVLREPQTEPWGLIEMWIEDPDGVPIVLVEVPPGHPIRRDTRPARPASSGDT